MSDRMVDIVNPGERFNVWFKAKNVHLSVPEGKSQISEQNLLLFSDALARHNCLVGEQVQDLSEVIPNANQQSNPEPIAGEKRGRGRPRIQAPALDDSEGQETGSNETDNSDDNDPDEE